MRVTDLKIITEPQVYLLGRQSIDDAELARFLADEGVESWETDTAVAGEKLVETAGRLCYMSFAKPRPGGNAAYVGHLLEVGHGSVLEHAVFNLVVTGVSRSLSHELVRHRVGISPSQLSQRYVDESDTAFVAPPLIAECQALARRAWDDLNLDDPLQGEPPLDAQILDARIAARWREAVAFARSAYEDLARDLERRLEMAGEPDGTARRKKAREAARSVLPNATETKLFLTGNARAWRHFIELRASLHADAEIRRLAVAVLETLRREAPSLFGDYAIVELPDGSRAATTPHRKV